MVAVLTSWVKYIVFVALFASFLELLLPNNSMQRFVRVIMGLFIMLAILNPLIDVVQNHLLPIQIPALSRSSSNSALILNRAENSSAQREQLTVELFKKELAQQMKVMITALDGVADAKIMISTNSVSSRINGVVVYVTPGIASSGTAIAKVSIREQSGPATDVNIELENKIKKLIAELYQLPKEIVEVKILRS